MDSTNMELASKYVVTCPIAEGFYGFRCYSLVYLLYAFLQGLVKANLTFKGFIKMGHSNLCFYETALKELQ